MSKFFLMKLFMMLFPIATVITGSLLGRMRKSMGKSITFASWKGIQYSKQYAIPSQPRTVAQVAQRNRFSWVLQYTQSVLITVIQKFWKKLAVKQSAFNAFMKYNLLGVTSYERFFGAVFSKGSLLSTSSATADYDETDGSFIATWNPAISGNQLPTDTAVFIITDDSNRRVVSVLDDGTLRSAGTFTTHIDIHLNADNLLLFLFFYRGLGTVTEAISNSTENVILAA